MNPWGDPRRNPFQPIAWPRRSISTEVQQVKAASQPSRIAVGQNTNPQSANQPKPVTITAIHKSNIGTMRNVTVVFLRDPGDTYFQKVNVHIKLGGGKPVLMVSGTTSPIVFQLPKSNLAAAILLQAEGNWGPHPLEKSPTRAFSLL